MSEQETLQEEQEETQEELPVLPPPGHINAMGLLDLTSAKTPEDLGGIIGISNVGCVLIPEHLAKDLARIPMKNVGNIIPLPEGENLNPFIGQVKLTGEGLAGGNPEQILLVIGQLFITTPVTSIGYKALWVYGQMLAVRGSEGAIGAKLQRVQGQTLYIASEARVIMGDETLDKEFFELLPEPRSFIIMGNLNLADDVTPELLRAKAPEIVLMGRIGAPKHLLAQVKALTTEKMGEIEENTGDGETAEGGESGDA